MRIDLASLDKCPDRPSRFGPTRKVVRGSDHGRAKLNEVAVQKIRDMSNELGTPVKTLAGVLALHRLPSTQFYQEIAGVIHGSAQRTKVQTKEATQRWAFKEGTR